MTPTPKRDSLTKRIGDLREHKLILDALAFDSEREVKRRDREVADAELLPQDSPYRRLCFVCGLRGECKHREQRVELAYAEAWARRRVS